MRDTKLADIASELKKLLTAGTCRPLRSLDRKLPAQSVVMWLKQLVMLCMHVHPQSCLTSQVIFALSNLAKTLAMLGPRDHAQHHVIDATSYDLKLPMHVICLALSSA